MLKPSKTHFFLLKTMQHEDINPNFPSFPLMFPYFHHFLLILLPFPLSFAGSRRARHGLHRSLRRAGGCDAAGGAHAEAGALSDGGETEGFIGVCKIL